MTADPTGKASGGDGRKHDHRGKWLAWPVPSKAKSPPKSWNSKTMHHPATRIGEMKHGKT
jgi:hypothetical protein